MLLNHSEGYRGAVPFALSAMFLKKMKFGSLQDLREIPIPTNE
jgi:hypothetical protein